MAIDLPPLRYDHPFHGKVVIEQIDLTGQWKNCAPYGGWACARRIGNICFVFIVEGKKSPKLIRHEIAHCNGWPADHPQ